VTGASTVLWSGDDGLRALPARLSARRTGRVGHNGTTRVDTAVRPYERRGEA